MNYVGKIIRREPPRCLSIRKCGYTAFRNIEEWHKSNPHEKDGFSYSHKSIDFDINDIKNVNLLVVAEKTISDRILGERKQLLCLYENNLIEVDYPEYWKIIS